MISIPLGLFLILVLTSSIHLILRQDEIVKGKEREIERLNTDNLKLNRVILERQDFAEILHSVIKGDIKTQDKYDKALRKHEAKYCDLFIEDSDIEELKDILKTK